MRCKQTQKVQSVIKERKRRCERVHQSIELAEYRIVHTDISENASRLIKFEERNVPALSAILKRFTKGVSCNRRMYLKLNVVCGMWHGRV